MSHWIEEQGLRWRALTPFGVEIDHDLEGSFAPGQAARFVRLFAEEGLVVARRQALSMERQRAVMALLGSILERAGETGYISTATGQGVSLFELSFHADGAYAESPLDALSLHAVDVVDGASATRFAHAERAYTQLPDALRMQIDGLEAELISPMFDAIGGYSCDVPEPEYLKRGLWPAVMTNPRNGRRYINLSAMHAARLVGPEWPESRALLHAVYEHLYAADNVMDHIWHRGDIVMWDNLAYQHARGPLGAVGRRVLQRVVVGIAGEAPHVRPAA